MTCVVKERDVDIYAAPDIWAGNPNVALLQSGEILIGFRCSGFPLRGDSDPTLRPYAMKASSVDDIPNAERVMILDEPNSLTPAFFQRDDGLILCFFNRYGTQQTRTIPVAALGLSDGQILQDAISGNGAGVSSNSIVISLGGFESAVLVPTQ